MQITFLGSGDAFGSGGRFQTCFLVEDRDRRFLIDCGSTSLVAMRRAGVDPTTVDTILITHLHGDHFGGLPFLLLDAQFRSKRVRSLRIAGPPGLEAGLRRAMEALFPGSTDIAWSFDLETIELPASVPTRIGSSLTVTPETVVHGSVGTPYGLRIACGGHTIAYSGDTQWTDRLVQLAAGCELFICESYAYDKPVPNHLDYRTLVEHRAQLRCERVILTHMGEEMLARAGTLEFELAADGLSVQLPGAEASRE